MKIPLPRTRAARLAFGTVVLMGALVVSSHWLETLRLPSPDEFASDEFHVTSGADSGPGTLREAIFVSDRSAGRTRIVIDVARVDLETALPPLVNPAGTVIEATRSQAHVQGLRLGASAAIDITSPDTIIRGLHVTNGSGPAILVRSSGTVLDKVVIDDSAIGIYLVERARELLVTNSTFRRNGVGIQLPGDMILVTLRNNTFEGHVQAAIWATAPMPMGAGGQIRLNVVRNRFRNDAQSFVVINIGTRLDGNVFEGARAAAVYADGATAIVRGNRIRSGRGFGLEVHRLNYGVIRQNEIDHNCAGGMLVRSSINTHIDSNRVYANGSGIVVVSGQAASPNTMTGNLVALQIWDGVHVIGGSPILDRNQLVRNRLAGLRLSTLVAGQGQVVVPQPRLVSNTVTDNGADETADEYSPALENAVPEPRDCFWRLGNDAQLAITPRP